MPKRSTVPAPKAEKSESISMELTYDRETKRTVVYVGPEDGDGRAMKYYVSKEQLEEIAPSKDEWPGTLVLTFSLPPE